jgi:hypothetical protein
MMCMVIAAQSIPQWQSGRHNLWARLLRSVRPADVTSQEMIDRDEAKFITLIFRVKTLIGD